MAHKLFLPLLLAALFCLSDVHADDHQKRDGLEYWCIDGNSGNCFKDSLTQTTGGTYLQGGFTLVDEGFKWMIEKGGHGDFVILRATGDDGYNKYVYSLFPDHPPATVSTFLITSRDGANDPLLLEKLNGAEVIFVAGGDQYNYVRNWNNTNVSKALNRMVAEGKVIGGTSAGMAIMSGIMFIAAHDTITSPEAMMNPYDYRVTLGDAMVYQHNKFMRNCITDTHFRQENRMGRLHVFLARMIADNLLSSPDEDKAYGIACNEQVAILIDHTTRLGAVVCQQCDDEHIAYVVAVSRKQSESTMIVKPDTPLTLLNSTVTRCIPHKSIIDFRTMNVLNGDAFNLSIKAGNFTTATIY